MSTLTKAELVEQVAKSSGLSKADSGRAIDAVVDSVEKGIKSIKKGGALRVAGLGTFSVRKRPARKGRNPQTGEEIKIAASKSVTLKVAKNLKDAAK